MLITLQYPLCDVRNLLEYDTGRLLRPCWPIPAADKEFVRSFGIVRQRYAGGIEGWIGEDTVCMAKRVLRIPNTPASSYLFGDLGFRLAFRSFYSDGTVVGKFEIGIISRTSIPVDNTIADAISAFLNLTVIVVDPLSGHVTAIPLIKAGNALARAFLASSSYTACFAMAADNQWWTTACAPVIVIERPTEYDDRTGLQIHKHYPGRFPWPDVLHHWLQLQGRQLNIWTFSAPKRENKWNSLSRAHQHESFRADDDDKAGAQREAARRLRIALLRIHAERECVLHVLRLLQQKRIPFSPHTTGGDKVQRYLAVASKRISRSEAATILPVVALANELDATITPGVREAIEQMRPHVQRLVTSLTESRTTLRGDEFRQLHEAIVGAFDPSSLHIFVRERMDVNPYVVLGSGNLTELVFSLVSWAERMGFIDQLAVQLAQERPDNKAIVEITGTLLSQNNRD